MVRIANNCSICGKKECGFKIRPGLIEKDKLIKAEQKALHKHMEALDALNEEEREEISPKYEVRVYKKFGDFFEKFIIS